MLAAGASGTIGGGEGATGAAKPGASIALAGAAATGTAPVTGAIRSGADLCAAVFGAAEFFAAVLLVLSALSILTAGRCCGNGTGCDCCAQTPPADKMPTAANSTMVRKAGTFPPGGRVDELQRISGQVEETLTRTHGWHKVQFCGKSGAAGLQIRGGQSTIRLSQSLGIGMMRIGIARSLTDSVSGGVFQYEMVLLKALGEIAARYPEELVYLSYHGNDVSTLAKTGALTYRGLPIVPLGIPSPQQQPPDVYIRQKPAIPPPFDPTEVKFNDSGADLMRQSGADLLFILSPNLMGFSYRIPFVVPVFDLNHRLQPEFPEVSAFGETNSREYFYINTCRFATLLLVDSEVGKSDVLRFYGDYIDEDRIRILPYYPPIEGRVAPSQPQLDSVRAKYNLPARYFFYPAQLWPHKNHTLILQAIKLIANETGETIPIVFCGAYWTYIMAHNFKDLMEQAAKLGIADRVRYLGPVPDADMAALYTLSAGLVMPTFFGPTNIPPLEAWHLGKPVITSDIPGIREQCGDTSLLVDPRSPQALAQAMKQVWNDPGLCAELVQRGKKRLAGYSWSEFVDGVAAVLTEACDRVRSGRTPKYPDLNQALPLRQRA